MALEIIVYFIGGLLAGIATGLVGLSAATIIAPLFATVLGMDVYLAIGVALASDILASATSAVTYIKNKNILFNKRSVIFGIMVLIFAALGSYFSKDTNPYNLASALNIFVVLLGIRFIVYPVKDHGQDKVMKQGKLVMLQAVMWGAIIGMISGYFGSGGGLSMLAVLTMLLGYKLKHGVGTSVFIMTFTALIAASVHFVIGGVEILPLAVTCVAAFIGANISSIFANKVSNKALNLTIGIFLLLFGITMVVIWYTTTSHAITFM
ncbi:Sulfite exporter TauE/SafE [Candidatus Izimaplasma bacterium HR1]|jgi:uncharacterized membrane protein YfcA|uniref:sulfite exporter TauE/SafE family protein n=1 Tax=Candidatus Izimoplasma sp. HR1 TaxID=1541959 RepID=UPI0004F8A85B|nr:Sulfite exporter TauE/SafE [Candidatus Izimaplasma bacterium HR1]